MRLIATRALLISAASLAMWGCENKKSPADKAGESAEHAAQEQAAAAGEGKLDQQIAGEVAKERAQLAVDVGENPAEVKRLEGEPAQTAAKDLAHPDAGAYREPAARE